MAEQKKIAMAVDDNGNMWPDHFGAAPWYRIYDGTGSLLETRSNPHGEGQPEEKEHGSPRETLELLKDCQVFIATLTGYYQQKVERQGVEVIITEHTDPDAALNEYLS